MLYCCMTHVVGHFEAEVYNPQKLEQSHRLHMCISTVFVIFCDMYTAVYSSNEIGLIASLIKKHEEHFQIFERNLQHFQASRHATWKHKWFVVYKSKCLDHTRNLHFLGNKSSIAKYHKYEDTHATCWHVVDRYWICVVLATNSFTPVSSLQDSSKIEDVRTHCIYLVAKERLQCAIFLYQSPKMKSKMTLFANTGGGVHSTRIRNCLRRQWFQSNAGSSYTCTLPNKTDTPRTPMQNFNGLQQFRNHFLLFSGTTPWWLQIIWDCEFCLENHWLTTLRKFHEIAF